MDHKLYLAYVYNSGPYGSGPYATGSNTTGSGSLLTNTGFEVAVIVTLACLIALTGIIVRFWKRPSKRHSAQQNATIDRVDVPRQKQTGD